MTDQPKKFTHVGIESLTQRKIALLALALETNIYSLVGYWADLEWKNALKAGLVTEAALGKRAKKASKVMEQA